MFTTIVVATDGSEDGDRAVSVAQKLAASSQAKVVVVHVKELAVGKSFVYPIRADEDEIEERIATQVSNMKAAGLDAELREHRLVMGGPAHLIAEDAKSAGADLVVCGTRGHNPVAGLLLGSVAQRLLSIAPCPVLVVPPERR
jgi:nucleotide-binding universal stress UspA family protein